MSEQWYRMWICFPGWYFEEESHKQEGYIYNSNKKFTNELAKSFCQLFYQRRIAKEKKKPHKYSIVGSDGEAFGQPSNKD
jgi:hypothetical protein